MVAFIITMILIFWRPWGINEAIPATLGAILVFLSGSLSPEDILDINTKVVGASITIIATMVMALTLESIGFFRWVATRLLIMSKGSGIRLFWLTNLLCFSITLFLNNDGSILITTPVLLLILKSVNLKNTEKLPYLISGALIATASSTPIGLSNIVNLISLKIIGMDLYLYTLMMFVPGTISVIFLATILYIIFHKKIPKKLPYLSTNRDHAQLSIMQPLKSALNENETKRQSKLMVIVLTFVFVVRILIFVASYFHIPEYLVAMLSAFLLLGWRWFYLKLNPLDMLKKTPWYIFIFAYTMYIIVYGLHNIGMTDLVVILTEPIIQDNLFYATMIMGTIISLMSNIFNNHPALMIGTLTITQLGLDPIILKTIYLASIIGSDIGSLLLPTGTLATLIWFHLLKKNKIKISWGEYLKVTGLAIPATVVFSLTILYLWIYLFFY
ncbi:arsenic transporter [Bacillus sp. V5-8f]|nr:arsenic transporter [Bacillus sp. V5-8f]